MFNYAERRRRLSDRMRAEGFGILVRRMQIEYLEPALLGDELEVATWAYHMRRATAARVYTIRRGRDGAPIARADAFYAWVNLKTGLPCRIPTDFRATFAPNIVP